MYEALVYSVMIASPGDVEEEREIAREIILEWNAANSRRAKIALMPLSWKTHSAPSFGRRPQAVINEQVAHKSDLLVAIFWTRLGSPTGVAASGTVEEIEEHLKAGKPVMIYFSTAPVRLETVDQDQCRKLQEYREECKRRGLVETFDGPAEFESRFRTHLNTVINSDRYFRIQQERQRASAGPGSPEVSVGAEAADLLAAASKDQLGHIHVIRADNGRVFIRSNRRDFIQTNLPQDRATWENALDQLRKLAFVERIGNGFGPSVSYQVTKAGYDAAARLESA